MAKRKAFDWSWFKLDCCELRGIVKKINIIDRTGRERWHKEIHIVLSDIDIAETNVAAVHHFRPEDLINVSITSAQLSLFSLPDNHAEDGQEEEVCGEERTGDEIVQRSFRF